MGRFRHHPDDHVYIDELYLPLSFFMIQEPLYNLPAPFISRDYIQPDYHILSDGQTQKSGGLPYTDGDLYISKKSIYQAAYEEFLNPDPTLSEAKIIKLGELDYYADNIKGGKVVYNSDTYFSTPSFFERIFFEYEKYFRAGSLPGSYYIYDDVYNNISFTVLANVAALIDKIIELWYLCDVNEDYHRVQINALTTVEDVQLYDFTGGWPTTPYN